MSLRRHLQDSSKRSNYSKCHTGVESELKRVTHRVTFEIACAFIKQL